ncbi:signal peptide peptidase SppA, 67K type [mine drainage metagenome]|uniref:Signal peptide peptidase SppA, 67K type n=1 Tax=mine drainage metagenome TaxID=410659 RepID=T1BZ78_9ZZZZ
MSQQSGIGHTFKTLGYGLNLLRVVILNLVFFGILALILLVLLHQPRLPAEPASFALVIGPSGELVEQLHNPVGQALRRMEHFGRANETPLPSLLRGIRLATHDPRVKAIVLETDRFSGGGMPEIDAVRRALLRFEKTGKPVVAVGRSYDTAQYLLASAATEIYLSPEGGVIPTGFGIYEPYMAKLLQRIGIHVYVVRVGKYKDAVEPFLRNSMSQPSREQWSAYFNSIWDRYIDEVSATRHLKSGALMRYIDQAATRLEHSGGNLARYALQAHLVNAVATRPAVHAILRKLVGPHGKDASGFSQMDLEAYLGHHPRSFVPGAGTERIALIHADGDIVSGRAPSGEIGSKSLIRLIREARLNPDIRALVLRVNSPGGSANASDEILHAIEAFEATGRPVVVSMGEMAASGGYWISMAADRIYAQPTTLTGSIGIFGIFPNATGLLNKIGVHVEGLGTTPLTGQFSPLMPLSHVAKTLFRVEVLHGYHDFIDHVARFRHMTPERVNAIGRGHIWVGSEALKLGLVDRLGGLQAAVHGAARMAHLVHYRVVTIRPKLTLTEKLIIRLAHLHETALLGNWFVQSSGMRSSLGIPVPVQALWHTLKGEFGFLKSRSGVYAYCLGCRSALLH